MLCYDYLMDFLFPLTAIISESLAKTVDKLNFKKNRIAAIHLMRLVFIGMGISLLLYILVTGKSLPDFSFIALGLVVLVAFVSFMCNVFDFLSLKADDISLREPMLGFEPILAGLFGYFLFPAEREEGFILAFALSTLVVYFGTHRRKLKRLQKKGMFYLSLAVLFYGILPSLYKFTMEYVDPEYLALFRVVGILLLASLFLPVRRYKKSIGKTTYGLVSGVVYALGTVASLYAIQALGVAQTMLLLLLSPALMYLVGYFVLKERVRPGEVISSAALAVIVVATMTS